jgi:large subunit ribosomal protein L32e
MRRRFKGAAQMPTIGFGSNNRTKHLLPNGFRKFQVPFRCFCQLLQALLPSPHCNSQINNVGELEVLLMHNRTYAAEIAHNVSTRKRKQIIERAAQLNVKVCSRVLSPCHLAAPSHGA